MMNDFMKYVYKTILQYYDVFTKTGPHVMGLNDECRDRSFIAFVGIVHRMTAHTGNTSEQ